MFKKYFYPVLGIAAFVVGGIVAKEKAIEIAETVEKALSNNSDK